MNSIASSAMNRSERGPPVRPKTPALGAAQSQGREPGCNSARSPRCADSGFKRAAFRIAAARRGEREERLRADRKAADEAQQRLRAERDAKRWQIQKAEALFESNEASTALADLASVFTSRSIKSRCRSAHHVCSDTAQFRPSDSILQ